MKKIIGTVIAITALTLAGCSSSGGYTTQNVQEFMTTISNSNVVVIDVRTPAEFASGHVANAVNIDVESGNFEQEISALDKSKTYALYCRSGRRSASASGIMSDAGFTSIVNLDGGAGDLANAGQQLVAP